MTPSKMEGGNMLWGGEQTVRELLMFHFRILGDFLHRPFCEMFRYREQIAAGSRGQLARALGTLSAFYVCLSQRDPVKVEELLLPQLPCKLSDKVCEGVEGGKASFMVAGGQW